MQTRVLVIDDTVLFRRLVSEALASVPGVEVVGTASNGRLGLSRIAALKPDLVTLDIEMPEMDGLQVLRALGSADHRPEVIILSAHTVRGGEVTLRALESGAFDFITKPEDGGPEANLGILRARLAPLVRAYEARRSIRAIFGRPAQSYANRKPPGPTSTLGDIPASSPRRGQNSPAMGLIALSTGGPAALARVLPAIPLDLCVPIFIVQHMPSLFTQSLAASLASKSAIRVTEAQDGETAAPGCAYIAPGGRHMKLLPGPNGEIMIRITDDPPENNCRPAADYLFRSVAINFPGRAVAAILTGMGNDGTAGLRMLKRSGCPVIAQDEASCVVFGMPREAIQAGVVDTIVPLGIIAETLVRFINEPQA